VTYYISSEVYKSQHDTENYEMSISRSEELELKARDYYKSIGKTDAEFEKEIDRATDNFAALAINTPKSFMGHKRMCDQKYKR
jgi:hypothetical protein